MEELAEKIVAAIEPASGWWKDSTREMLEDAALTLLIEGVDEDDVEEVLHRIVGALRAEYGE